MNKLIEITHYDTTRNLVDVVFTKGSAERRAILDRKAYENWIVRTDRNQFPFTYTCGEQKLKSVGMCPIENYWCTDEVSEEHHKAHLYDYLISNNLHYDEVLAKWQGKPFNDVSVDLPIATTAQHKPAYRRAKEQVIEERERQAVSGEFTEYDYFHQQGCVNH